MAGKIEGAAAARPARRGWVVKVTLVVVVLVLATGGLLVFLRSRSPAYRMKRLQDEAALALKVGKADEAAKLLAQAVAIGPDIPGLSVQLARALEVGGKGAEAEKVLRESLEKAPRNIPASTALATRLTETGRATEAQALLEPLADRIRAMPDLAERGQALLVLGRTAARAGAPEKAVTYLTEAAAIDSVRVPALTALGLAHAELGKFDQAEKSFRDAAAAAPQDPAPILGLARALELSDRPADAIAALETFRKGGGERRFDVVPAETDLLIRLRKTSEARALGEEVGKEPVALGVAAYARGVAAFAEGDYATAEAQLTRMAEVLPRSTQPRLLAAQAAMRRGAPERARALLTAALEVDPTLYEADLALLDLDSQAGDAAAVRARAERLLEPETTRPRALRALLATYAQDGDAQGALKRLADLRQRFPKDAGIRLNEAVFRVLAGEVDKGVADLAALAQEDPDMPGAFALMAGAAEAGADTAEAIEQLALIAAKDPRFANARVALVGVYEKLGRRDLARREADMALKDKPDLREARLARARLEAAEGDWPGAIADLEKVAGPESKDIQALVLLAQMKDAAGDTAGAVKPLERAVELAPRSAQTLALLARVLSRVGDDRRALATWEKARAAEPRLPAAHEDGAMLLARGDAAGAAAAFARGLEATRDVRYAGALAAARAIMGEAPKALEPMALWRARAGSAPAEGVITQAIILTLAGEKEQARAGVRIAPVPVEVRAAALAVGAGPNGQPDARTRFALELFGLSVMGWRPELKARVEVISREPGADPLLLWWATRALAASGRADPGLRVGLARRLAAVAPSEPAATLELADALGASGDAAGELAALKVLRQRFPESPVVSLRLGMAYERAGKVDEAVAEYTHAAAPPDAAPAALNNLAYFLAKDPARRPAALDLARRAARAAPRVGQILDTLGWIFLLDGQVDEATATLTRAVAVAPVEPTIRYHLALALDAHGDLDRVIGQLETALLARGDFPERADAQALLERLKAERDALSAGAAGAKALDRGAPVEGTLSGAPVILRIPPGPEGRVVKLALRAAGGAALHLRQGTKVYAGLEARAGEEASIPRLALAPEGHLVVVRPLGGAGGAFKVSLEEAPAEGGEPWEREPNEAAAQAVPLAVGRSLAGAVSDPGDRDCVRLDIPAGGRARVVVSAGPKDVRADLVVAIGANERPLKSLRVSAGTEASLEDLAPHERGPLVVRLASAGTLSEGAGRGAAAAGGGSAGWKVRLAQAESPSSGDVEPNDRDEEAISLAPGAAAVKGRIGPADAVDWFKVAVPAGDMIAVRLKDLSAAKDAQAPSATSIALELWERMGDRRLPARRCPVAAGGELRIARWRTPRVGELLVAVVLEQGVKPGAAFPYELALETATTPEGFTETEPNDRLALADVAPSGAPIAATLDVRGDRDWYRAPPAGPVGALSLRIEADERFEGAVVSVFADPDREGRLIASFDCAGGNLEVPAIRAPDVPVAAVVLATGQSPPGAYRLTFKPAEAISGLEVEPNDDAGTAMALSPGTVLRGVISGLADRDVFHASGRGTVRVRATGKAPITVAVRGEPAPRVLQPSQDVVLGPDVLGGGESALVEIAIPRPADVAGIPEAIARARLGAAYEVGAEGGR